MKQAILFIFFVIFSLSLTAQVKGSAASVKPYLEKVIAAVPTQFFELRGENLSSDPGTSAFTSTLQIPGSLENKVIGYLGKSKNYWVWESKLLVTEDFEQFRKTYRSYYNDIGGNNLLKGVSKRFVAATPYENPDETQRLWSNQFRINQNQAPDSNLLIDLVAENIGFEWVIWLRVYEKERDADMRPTEKNDEQKK
jgi:hypothetical protein